MSDETIPRSAHMASCKARALAYLPDDPKGAIASMLSDLRKHPQTANHAGTLLTMALQLNGHLSTSDQVRRHIEGFN